jgi:hypothetical protein
MFRVHLNVETPGEVSRQAIVEGRTGFTLVSGTASRQSRMFPSPKGSFVISGMAGGAWLTETGTQAVRNIRIPNGWLLATAAFSPDETHFVATLVQPQRKEMLSILVDSGVTSASSLPPQMQFLSWLSNDKVLMRGQAGLVEYSIRLGAGLPIAAGNGWESNQVIAGTGSVILRNVEGGLAVRKAGEPQVRVLERAAAVRDTAVADDLSQFGGVDAQGRLWVQRGFQAAPEVIAERVTHVAWSPISRRAAVRTADGETRIYDGRAGNWSPLGAVVMGSWSADESRFLYITGRVNAPESLVLWSGGQIRELCAMHRIGDVAGMALSESGGAAFLLAGAESGFQVWMMALPF